jgi:hypothetical protein
MAIASQPFDPTHGAPAAPGATCGLEGCRVPLTRQDRGGRAKLYCSDAHRAQARRRRLRTAGAGGEEGGTRALEALRQAAALVEEALAARPTGLDAQMAQARAEATAQVLEAQRVAADATRQLAAARRRFDEEKERLEAALAVERTRAARDRATIDELQSALEGARAELQDELLRHHRDVQALEEEGARRGSATT